MKPSRSDVILVLVLFGVPFSAYLLGPGVLLGVFVMFGIHAKLAKRAIKEKTGVHLNQSWLTGLSALVAIVLLCIQIFLGVVAQTQESVYVLGSVFSWLSMLFPGLAGIVLVRLRLATMARRRMTLN